MNTYPEMDGEIVGLLRLVDNPTTTYAALRIEELEAECARLRTACEEVIEWIEEPDKGRTMIYPHLGSVVLPNLKSALTEKGE